MPSLPQSLLFTVLLVMLVLFIWNRFRYDLVSLGALLACLFLGIVPMEKAFSGFSHSAVITVAAIFIVSRGIENTGVLGELAYRVKLRKKSIWKQVGLLCMLVAGLSAIMNNVGALALLMPVALNIARSKNIPRYLLLMPMAFSALLGGLITLVGTPPNLIVSDYRRYHGAGPFTFFDFTFVGLSLAVLGVAFIAAIGWRLIPRARSQDAEEMQRNELFTADLIISSQSRIVGKKIAQLIHAEQDGSSLLALVRDGQVIRENLSNFTARANDRLIVEVNKWRLRELISDYQLIFSPHDEKVVKSDHYLLELVVLPDSILCRDKISVLDLEELYGLSIVAASRRQHRLRESLPDLILKPGDALVVKSDTAVSPQVLETLGCLTLESTHVRPFSRDVAIRVFSVLLICLMSIVFGFLRADVAFVSAAVGMLAMQAMSIENVYRQISWPVIVLVGALIPVGEAMESTGATRFLVDHFHSAASEAPAILTLFLLINASMVLSNLINNAAVALVFSPIALNLATVYDISPDPLLMGVAVGASCTFLTPIGHQCNAIILGPGNYQFKDYWWMGLPLSVIISLSATVLISIFWPF